MPVLAEVPALPLHTAGKYVAAAYIVLFALLLIYVTVIGIRLSHMERDLGELLELSDPSRAPAAGARARGSGAEAGAPAAAAAGETPEDAAVDAPQADTERSPA